MDATIFITLAYAATGLLLLALFVASWLRARAVKRQLASIPGV